MTRTARCVLGLRVMRAATSHPTDLPATPTDNTQFEEKTNNVLCVGVACSVLCALQRMNPPHSQLQQISRSLRRKVRVICWSCVFTVALPPNTPHPQLQRISRSLRRQQNYALPVGVACSVFCASQTPTSYLELSIISCILRSFFVHANSGSLRYEIAYPFALVKHFRANGIMLSASPRNP